MRAAAIAWISIALGSIAARCEQFAVDVDFGRITGVIRPLNGLNQGPLAAGGLIDLSPEFRALQPPLIRLHDCHWPNSDVVDIHAVFPNFAADPELPESYDFRRTDEYIAAVRATGAKIVYRLGESIEHATARLHVHPPPDTGKWAAICAGIVRHYNEGWADGFRYGITYWEIWNEPENRPACWTGTDEQYFELYRTTSRVLKTRWPDLKIGGPAVGAPGSTRGDQFTPTPFVRGFLELCRRERLPLDFFSWHQYTDDPGEFAQRGRHIRALLDEHGLSKTENHLNEWNFLPGKSWAPTQRTATAVERRRFYESMSGPAGAAFIASSLRAMQDSPIDAANFFRAEPGAFGLFDEYGVPHPNYRAFQWFAELQSCANRVALTGEQSGMFSAIAGLSDKRDRAALLIAHRGQGQVSVQVRWGQLPWTSDSTTGLGIIAADGERQSRAALGRHQESSEVSFEAPGIVFITAAPAQNQ